MLNDVLWSGAVINTLTDRGQQPRQYSPDAIVELADDTAGSVLETDPRDQSAPAPVMGLNSMTKIEFDHSTKHL